MTTIRINPPAIQPTLDPTRATKAWAKSRDDGDLTFDIFATIGGQDVNIGESSKFQSNDPVVLVSGDGQKVYFTTASGGYGYENEGEAIWSYDAKSGETTNVMTEYCMIDELTEVRHGDKSYIVASMSDGGEGAMHLAIVDSARGEVYTQDHAILVSSDDKGIKVGVYGNKSMTDDEGALILPPPKVITVTFDKLAKNKVIVNEPDWV